MPRFSLLQYIYLLLPLTVCATSPNIFVRHFFRDHIESFVISETRRLRSVQYPEDSRKRTGQCLLLFPGVMYGRTDFRCRQLLCTSCRGERASERGRYCIDGRQATDDA